MESSRTTAGEPFGRRMVVAALGAWIMLSPLPALATDGAANLAAAEAALRTGHHATAIAQADAAFASNKLSSAQIARALYVRGNARLASGQSASAISDLTSALWTKQLPPELQRKASKLRAQAYISSGIDPSNATPVKRPAPRSQTLVSWANRQPSKTRAQKAPASQAPALEKTHKVALPTALKSPSPQGFEAGPALAARPSSQPNTQGKSGERVTSGRTGTAITPQAPPPARWATSSVRNLPTQILNAEPARQASAKPNSPPPARTTAARITPTTPMAGPGQTAAQALPAWSSITTGSIATGSVSTGPVARDSPSTTHAGTRPATAAPTGQRTTTNAPLRPFETSVAPTTARASTPATQQRQPAMDKPAANNPALIPNLLGNLFASTEKVSDDVAMADELQRRRAEQIRAHNERLKQAQPSGTAPAPGPSASAAQAHYN